MSPVAWKILAIEADHRVLQLLESLAAEPTTTRWRFSLAGNALAEVIGRCEFRYLPDDGRYAVALGDKAEWNAAFAIEQACCYEQEEVHPVASCEAEAKVHEAASVTLQGVEHPALAIERFVLCRDERNPGAVWVRWEQELYCTDLAFRCGLDHRWAILPPGEATPERLAAWRADPAAQRYDGRQVDRLVAAGPR